MKKTLLCLAIVAAAGANAATIEKATDLISAKPFTPRVLSTRQLPNGQTEAVVALNAPTRSEASMEFSYADTPYQALSFNNLGSGTTVYQAVYMPQSVLADFDGCKVTGFTLYSGAQSNVTSATVFFAAQKTTVLTDPLYTETFTGLPTADYQKINLTLATPFEISADQPFYVGYSAQPTDGYYIVVDGLSGMASENTCLIGTKTKTGSSISWQTAYDYGSLCIGLIIQGESLPENGLSILAYDAPANVSAGVDFPLAVAVKNPVAGSVSSFGYEYQIGEETPVSGTYTFPAGMELASGSWTAVQIDNVVCNTVAYQLPYTFKITTVNGEANYVADAAFSGTINCLEAGAGYDSHVLIEEGTGTWCGYCPLGITMMEMAKAIDPDFFHCVALHSGDNMEVSSFSLVSSFFTGFPSAMVNRGPVEHPANIIPELEPLYASLSNQKTYAGITGLNVEVKGDGTLDVATDVEFAFDFGSSNTFRLGIYLTEDGMGPYYQANNYANAGGDYYGWENKGSRVKMTFDDVAREIVGGKNGITGSIPTTITAGETYSYTKNVSLANVTSDDFYVIAYIINRKNNTIVNSCMIPANKTMTSVAGVEAEAAAKVYGVEGAVVVNGDFEVANVYNMAGQKVAEVANGTANVPAGIYVVNVDGKATKVVVK